MALSEGAAVSAAAPDLVYVLGPTEGPELRYSLRSVAKHLPHRKVWLVGTIPAWVRNVETIPLPPVEGQYLNMRQSWEAAANHPDVSASFVAMNDDYMVIEPIESVADHTLHRGEFWPHYKQLTKVKMWKNPWMVAMKTTAMWVHDRNQLAYECHSPLLYDKQRLRKVLAGFPPDTPFAIGEVYELAGAGGVGRLSHDTKVGSGRVVDKLGTPFLSTHDDAFRKHEIGKFIRDMFPDKCMYEE